MISYPKLSNDEIRKRLTFPAKFPIRTVLDTDTYNEVDDQFALAYMLLSPETYELRGVYAAPFFNSRSSSYGHGMELSYEEILNVLGCMGIDSEGLVCKGSDRGLTSLDEPVDSPAARHLINEALASTPEDPLHIIAIGAITNVASALLLEPAIHDRVVLTWLGGNILPNRNGETHDFNTEGDLLGTRFIYDCGVPHIQIGCWGVTSHLTASVPELRHYLSGKNRICDLLIDRFSGYVQDTYGWSKELWDVGAAACFINKDWFVMEEIPSRTAADNRLTDYEGDDPDRHIMLTTRFLNRTEIFRDMFKKLSAAR